MNRLNHLALTLVLSFAAWGASAADAVPGPLLKTLMSKELGGLALNWQWVDQPNDSTQHKPGYLCEWDAPPR